MSSLTELYLWDNQLTGPIPNTLGQLSYLTRLYLNINRLTGPIPDSLGQLTSLIVLGLNENQLTGSIPTSLGQLTGLTGLGLYNNKLTGSIPESLGSLSHLTALGLYNNQLSGSIPASLGQLTQLEVFGLHNNQLTGLIPTSLDNLVNLKVLYLHKNKLEGGYEGETWNLSPENQRLIYGMKDFNAIAVSAAKQGLPRTMKYIAVNHKSDVMLLQSAGKRLLALLVENQPVHTYDMLYSLPLHTSAELMYRRYKERIYGKSKDWYVDDDVGESFEYALKDGEWCIRGSSERAVEGFWFAEVNGQQSYLLSLWNTLSCFSKRPASAPKIITLAVPADESTAEQSSTSFTHGHGADLLRTLRIKQLKDPMFPVVSYTLPFEYMSSYYFLKAFVDVVDHTQQFELFDNENVMVAVTAAWQAYGRPYHLALCGLYATYLALLSYSNFAYQSQADCYAVSIAVLCLNSILCLIECYQVYMFGILNLSDYHNYLEVAACVLVYVGTITRIQAGVDTTGTEEVMAIASVLVWYNALNYLRPFDLTGPLILMISKVTVRIIPFALILLILIFGFSQGFFLVADNSTYDSSFATMQQSYLAAYTIVIGSGIHTGLNLESEMNDLMIALQTIFSGFVQILLLNLLIAFLNYIYSGIQEKSKAVGCYERCRIIVSQVRPWSVPMGERWIHFIKKEIDVKNDINKNK